MIRVWFCAAAMAALLTAGASTQGPSFSRVGSIRVPVNTVKVQGRYAYVAGDTTFSIIDISNPAVPARVGAFTVPDRIWGFAVSGAAAYVAADLWGIGILDISNPAAPVLRTSFKTRGQAHSVDVWGSTALVADHMQGIVFLDLSNPLNPASKGAVFLEGYPRHVAVLGSLAYAVDSPNGFYVIDPSKPPLDPLGSVQTPEAAFGRFIAIAVSEASGDSGRRVAAVTGGRALHLYDVTNPIAPTLLARHSTPGGGDRLAIKDRLVYVADGVEGLQLVDVGTPSKPQSIGTFKTPTPALDVAFADSLILLAAGRQPVAAAVPPRFEGDELLILRQTSP